MTEIDGRDVPCSTSVRPLGLARISPSVGPMIRRGSPASSDMVVSQLTAA